jgi:SpoVK/Ycf46/Vps4 family AAA+-type ATPase
MRLPFIAIDPSHFLREGLERIAGMADEIFSVLMDLQRGVVFFDEMDPLVASRAGNAGEQQFIKQAMTTALLPKLAALYDENRVVFFMATNHFDGLDTAIRRPGRFDFLVCVGPPTWKRKLDSLISQPNIWKRHASKDKLKEQLKTAHDKLQGLVDTDALKRQLDRFTFGEMNAFFDAIRGDKWLDDALAPYTKDQFDKLVAEWVQKSIILWKKEDRSSPDADEYFGKDSKPGDISKSRRQ